MKFIKKVILRAALSVLMLICYIAVAVKETVYVLTGKYDEKLFGDCR